MDLHAWEFAGTPAGNTVGMWESDWVSWRAAGRLTAWSTSRPQNPGFRYRRVAAVLVVFVDLRWAWARCEFGPHRDHVSWDEELERGLSVLMLDDDGTTLKARLSRALRGTLGGS